MRYIKETGGDSTWLLKYWDRETRRHFEEKWSKGPYFGVLYKVKEGFQDAALEGLDKIVGVRYRTEIIEDGVAVSEVTDQKLLERLKKFQPEGHVDTMVLEASYETFVGGAEKWAWRYNRFKNRVIMP